MNTNKEIVVILNNIRSSENVGSIFRTCDAVGVKKIILTGITPAPIDRFGRENRGFIKASLGAEKTVAWQQAQSLKEAITTTQKFFSEYSQKCTDIFLLKNSDVAAQSRSQGISENIRSKNFWIVGIEQSKNSINYKDLKTSKLLASSSKLALVFGNEVEGLKETDLKLCDLVAEIPMCGKKESLNVSVVAGIVLYELAPL